MNARYREDGMLFVSLKFPRSACGFYDSNTRSRGGNPPPQPRGLLAKHSNLTIGKRGVTEQSTRKIDFPTGFGQCYHPNEGLVQVLSTYSVVSRGICPDVSFAKILRTLPVRQLGKARFKMTSKISNRRVNSWSRF